MNFTKEFKPSGGYLNGFVRDYVNNSENSFIEFIPSSTFNGYPITNIFDYSSMCTHWGSLEAEDGLNSFLKIKVKRFGLVISHFSIISHCDNRWTMTSWIFEASSDGKHYDTLVNKTNSADLDAGALKLYEVNPMNKIYNVFRIRQTSVTRLGNANMRIAKIDVFGLLVTVKQKTCMYYRNSNNKLHFVLIFMIYSC